MQENRECKRLSRKLVDYASGELFGTEAQRIGDHLERCEQCRRGYEEIVAVGEMVCWAEPEPLLAHVVLTARVQKPDGATSYQRALSLIERVRWAMRRPISIYGVVAAVVLFLAVAVVFATVQRHQRQQPEPLTLRLERGIVNLSPVQKISEIYSSPLIVLPEKSSDPDTGTSVPEEH